MRMSLLAALVVSTLAAPAQAHVHLVGSEPPSGAKVAAPRQARLVFDGQIETRFGKFALADARGKALKVAPLPAGHPHEVRLALPALDAGRHTLRWSVVARDGHRARGTLAFEVR